MVQGYRFILYVKCKRGYFFIKYEARVRIVGSFPVLLLKVAFSNSNLWFDNCVAVINHSLDCDHTRSYGSTRALTIPLFIYDNVRTKVFLRIR